MLPLSTSTKHQLMFHEFPFLPQSSISWIEFTSNMLQICPQYSSRLWCVETKLAKFVMLLEKSKIWGKFKTLCKDRCFDIFKTMFYGFKVSTFFCLITTFTYLRKYINAVLPEPKEVSICHQYRARSAFISVQSYQALNCWQTNFKFS